MEEEKKWCVYIHRNMVNDKAYIGITTQGNPNKRWQNGSGYRKYQSVFYNAIQKYGWDNFEHIIWAEDLTEDEAKAWEIRLIALFKTNCRKYKNPEYGYNMTDGGAGATGLVHSDETKKIIGNKNRKRYSIPENTSMYGKHHSEETKERIRDTLRKINLGEGNPFYGKHHSAETKEKMREYALNRPEEHNKKISEAQKERFKNPENRPMYGKHLSEESREKMRKAKEGKYQGKDNPNYGRGRHVVQLSIQGEYIAEYISAYEAQKNTGINGSSIRNCCNINYKLKTAGGYRWMYLDDYEQLNNDIKGEV